MTTKGLFAVAAAYGATLGIGYGFRTDFLIEIPLFPIVVLAFLPGRMFDRLPAKLTAIGVCGVVFTAVAWPILTTIQQRGGCQWHAVLLGLTDGPTDGLMVSRAPYAFGHDFSDDFVYAAATAYAVRTQPRVGHIEYCSHEYDGITGRYVADLVRQFPGDFLTRGLASVVQVVQLPFRWFDQPLPGWWSALYAVRRVVLKPLRGWGVVPIAATILGLTAANPRLGLFALFFLLYVGGYPALQFDIRHYFHLEVITWWALGFVAHHVTLHWRAADRRVRPTIDTLRRGYNWTQAVRICGGAAVGIVIALWACRGYQQVSAARLFQTYIDAPKQGIPLTAAEDGWRRFVLPRVSANDPRPADLVEVDLDSSRCANASVLFAYERPFSTLSHVYRIDEQDGAAGPTRIFQPVFAGFAGVQLSGVTPTCMTAVSRVAVPVNVPLLLPAMLPPSWRRRAMFEQMVPLRWRW